MKVNGFLSLSQKIRQVYGKLCRPVLLKYGLSQVSFDVLMFVSNAGRVCTAQEISEGCDMKKNLVSVHVEQLVQGGYLLRESVDGDRRKIGLRCTERAQPIVREGIRIYTELFEGITKGLSKQEIEQCYQSLLTIEVNADRML